MSNWEMFGRITTSLKLATIRGVQAAYVRLRSIALWNVPDYTRGGLYTQGIFWLLWYIVWALWPAYLGFGILPGFAIGALAVAAVIMTARGDRLSKGEQIVWILIAFALFVEETHVLNQDRRQQEQDHRAEMQRQEQQFETTLNRFSDSEKSSSQILEKAGQAADFAKDGILEMTGADSFLMIYPHGRLLNGQPVDGTFDLLNGVIGKHAIWDGRIFMRDGSLTDPNYLFKPTQEFDLKPVVPTQVAGFGKFIQPPKSGITAYNFSISSRGPLVLEELDIKFNSKANRWEYKYVIWEPLPFKKTPKPPRLIKQVDWTPMPYPRLQ